MKPNFIKTYATIPLLKQKVWIEIKTFATEEYQQLALIKSFEEDLNVLITEAREGIRDQNSNHLLQSLHTLRGIAGTLGAARLQFITRKAEKMKLIDATFIDEIEDCGKASLLAMNKSCG